MKEPNEDLKQKAKELKNAYQNQWRKKNPEKVKKYIAGFWERKAASLEEEKEVEAPIWVTGQLKKK